MYDGPTISTGNPIVDQIAKMDVTGHMIPDNWFSWILRENGKPNLLAMHLLSEIVYWYKPAKEVDEASGRVIGYKKKFSADLLQKSYDDLAEKYGDSKKTIQRALDVLESLGVIRREFRTIEYGKYNKKANNVMFIELIPEGLYKVTFGDSTDKKADSYKKNKNSRSLSTKMSTPSGQDVLESMDEDVETDM